MTANLFKFPFLLCLLFFPFHLAANGGGLRILSRKDSAIFRRQSVQLNCSEPACHGPLEPIFCAGPIVWATWQFGMQKECPGNRLRYSPEIVLQNFDNAFDGDSLRRDAFQRFCEENFDNRPYLETARLSEWKEEPKMFARIRDPKMKFFAQQIHKIWPLLSKRFVDDVRRNPSRYPVLAVPNPFIVPSSLFQVYFYWDSYWIIRGLLISDLFDTVRGMIDNFSFVIKQIGHIPNSGNVQFSRRSQPPMFTQMLFDFFLATEAHSAGNAHGDFVRQQLEWAEKELEWWRRRRTVQMSPLRRQTRYGQLRFADDHPYTLFRYKTKTNCPRPEGFLLDFQFGIDSGREDLEFFWSSTTSAAESGMDFSSRWFSTDDEDEEMAYTRKGIETNNVLPVDLNVFMALNYRAMAQMHGKFGNQEKAKIFEELAENLIRAIDDVFRVQEGPNGRMKGKFDQNDGLWFDYDLAEHRLRKRFYPSDIFPLLLLRKGTASDGEETEEGDGGNGGNETMKASDAFDAQRGRNCERVLAYLERIGAVGFRGGLPSSMERNSVELWDFPIAWPPTTHLAVLALLRCRNGESTRVARKIADGFITTAYNGLLHTRRGMPSQIWEKYDARFDDGRPGFGADYLEQIGFGWTNGVLLDFIRLFHTDSGDPEAFWRPI